MGANKRSSNSRVRYGYKSPKFGRATFSIYEDVVSPSGDRKCRKVVDERLLAINQSFKIGAQDLHSCTFQVKEIIKDLYRKDPRCQPRQRIVHNAENHKVLDDYWEKEYSHRTLENEDSTWHELVRVIDTLGTLSIYSASKEEIQNAIDAKVSGNVQRRMISRFSQLLKFVGRSDLRLRKDRRTYNKVEHLTEAEFALVVTNVEDKAIRALMEVCFYSGLRIGEAFALVPNSLVGEGKDTLRIASQVDRAGNFKPSTKTKKPRLAYILPAGLPAFHVWVAIPKKEKDAIRRLDMSKVIKRYCRKLFPDDGEKHITFHGLRHSYAIHLLVKGVSMSLVAQSLGNSLSVCQYYYVGYELSNESVAAIRSIVAASSK